MADDISHEWEYHEDVVEALRRVDDEAFRRGKAEGLREATRWIYSNKETCGWNTRIEIGLRSLAAKIERGEV